jgi:hypothetical protein
LSGRKRSSSIPLPSVFQISERERVKRREEKRKEEKRREKKRKEEGDV